MVRSGRAAAAPPAVPGAPPARGRAGRSGSARPVPARVARARRGGSTESPFRGSAALERLATVVDQLAGLAIPASVLERDVLPARIPGYQPRLLDELGSLGEVGWVGRGSLGRDDGRIALFRPGREALRPRVPRRDERPAGPATTPSASTWPAAAHRSIARSTRPPAAAPTARCSTPCGTSCGPARSRTTRSRPCARCAGSGPAGTRGSGRAA